MGDVSVLGTDHPSLSTLYGGWIKRTALMLKSRMPWADLDELLQWGAVGMLESMNRFDRTLGISFEAFASRRIRGAMIDGLRRDGALRRGESILEPDAVDTAALAGGTSPDDPLALLLRADAKTLLVEALRSLPTLEYQVLAMHFYDDMNNREIAAILDVSEGYASRIRKRALLSLSIRMKADIKGETVS